MTTDIFLLCPCGSEYKYQRGHKRGIYMLTHWGRVTHIWVNKLTTTSSDNGLSPGRRQVIIWTYSGILLIGPLGTNFSEILILIKIHTFSFKETRFKLSSGKWRPFCLGLNMLTQCAHQSPYLLNMIALVVVVCNYIVCFRALYFDQLHSYRRRSTKLL